jgi:hypothetical protein
VFIAIACFWQANVEAWPSQETIATFSGYSSRAVRDYIDVLDRMGVVRTRRVRQGNGAERIYYAPGLVTLSELAAFVDRHPRERAKPVRIDAPPERTPVPPTRRSTENGCTLPHRKRFPWNRESQIRSNLLLATRPARRPEWRPKKTKSGSRARTRRSRGRRSSRG